jgi:metal-responsive CopG/Arc/MetJ family transcriptional regulator
MDEARQGMSRAEFVRRAIEAALPQKNNNKARYVTLAIT